MDITAIFDEHNLDESTLLCLFDAAANVEIARYFSKNVAFKETLRKLEIACPTDTKRQLALQRLNTRMEGWRAFENALGGGTPDYSRIHAFLLDISSEEFSVGCWLESVLNLEQFSTILGDSEKVPSTEVLPLILQGEEFATYADFVGFTRAMACIACVCAVLAWADSDEKDECRERALGTLVLWQNMDGYREVSCLFRLCHAALTIHSLACKPPSAFTTNDQTPRVDNGGEGCTEEVVYLRRASPRRDGQGHTVFPP